MVTTCFGKVRRTLFRLGRARVVDIPRASLARSVEEGARTVNARTSTPKLESKILVPMEDSDQYLHRKASTTKPLNISL